MDKFKHGRYWIELKYIVIRGKRKWFWQVKTCNGRIKCISFTQYDKRCLCYNDAIAFSMYNGMIVRGKNEF